MLLHAVQIAGGFRVLQVVVLALANVLASVALIAHLGGLLSLVPSLPLVQSQWVIVLCALGPVEDAEREF